MGIFRFRRFSVENMESAMKVNTDGVLLGALMTVRPLDRKCLDVGTGTGTIALMAAQRLADCAMAPETVTANIAPAGAPGSGCKIMIFGIDIDEASAREAGRNFAASPWPDMLEALHTSLKDFMTAPQCTVFDHIFSNPPYYDLSLGAPDARRNAARHTQSLSYRELVAFASVHLAQDGLLSLILPADAELWLLRYARMSGLCLSRIVRIRTSEKKRFSRIMAEFSRAGQTPNTVEEVLTIHQGQSYTPEYAALTRDFYIR